MKKLTPAVLVFCAVVVSILNINLLADDCPSCIDPSGGACNIWGRGRAFFQWASGEDVGSDITLTAGGCSCPESGETGKGYILAVVDTHNATCDGESPCGSSYQSGDYYAIIEITGNKKAFEYIFPDGISFTGDYPISTQYGCKYSGVNVDRAGCKYSLKMAGGNTYHIGLSPTVSRCSSQYDNSKFNISVKFYQEHDGAYATLASTTGSITVKENPRRNFNPETFKPDVKDGTAIGWIEIVNRDYDQAGNDSQWSLNYKGGGWGYCDSYVAWAACNGSCGTVIPDSDTFYRVKYPGWKKPVNGLPGYIAADGWSYNATEGYIKYEGSEETIYFHCNTPDTNEGTSGKYYISKVEYCGSGTSVGNGETKWSCKHEYHSPAKLHYIYNGDDPNGLNATIRYAYVWGGDGNDPNVVYQTRDTAQDAWQTVRQWQLEFDSEDRAVKFQGGCGSCGGSSDFEHIEYYGNTDLISKRWNADGDVIVENTYGTVDYGEIETVGWLYISNYSFELPDITGGTSSNELPTDWADANGGSMDIYIVDPNDSTPPDGSQVLRPNGDAIEYTLPAQMFDDTLYLLEAEIKAIPSQYTSTATISLYTTETAVAEEDRLLAQISFTEDANEGVWIHEEYGWDSSVYEDEPISGDFDNDPQFRIVIAGNYVEIDDVRLSAAQYFYQTTQDILTQRKTRNSDGNLVVTFERTIDQDNGTMLEKRYTDSGDYRLTKLVYDDDYFGNLIERIEYGTVSDSAANPTGDTFTTEYTVYDPNGHYMTTYPNGRRADYARYVNGNLVESYVVDLENDANSFNQQFTYELKGNAWRLTEQVNPRGGVTEYSYQQINYPGLTTYLLQEQTDPNNTAGRQKISYTYDDAQRILTEARKLDDSRNLRTSYSYNSETGFLDSMIVNGATTSYTYNDFGQTIRQINPDGIKVGKSYGTGGEFISEFVIEESCDPNTADTNLTLISQTRYTYTDDGKIETVGKYKSDTSFSYQSDMTTNPNNWIVTKYEYYTNGKKHKVIEDYGTGRTNLTTEFEYNYQGEVEKVTYPTGKWTRTTRDGRGLIILEEIGYDSDTVVLESAFSYDDNGNLQQQSNPDGSVLVYTYDNYDRLKRTYQGDTEGPYSEKFYNNAGDVTRQIACEADGTVLSDSRIDYDDLGNVMFERQCYEPNSIDNDKDFTSHYQYNIAGNLRFDIKAAFASTEPNGITTEFRYNEQGRQSVIIDPNGYHYSKYFTSGGLIYKSIDPNNPADPNAYITQNVYDAYGRLEKTINPEGHYTKNIYNSLGQITKQIVYDGLNPYNSNDDYPVRQTRMVYDNLGNITRQAVMADPNETGDIALGTDLVTDYVFEPNGLLSEQKIYVGLSATEAKTTFSYDQIGRRIMTTDPENNTERIYYNSTDASLGSQAVKVEQFENDPDGNNDYTVTSFMLYDGNGRLSARLLDEDGSGDISSGDPNTRFAYDGLNRITHTTAPDEVVTFTVYDGFGNVKQTIEDYDDGTPDIDHDRKTEFVYNRLNQQVQIKAYDPNETTSHIAVQTTEYEYNSNGLVTKITYPDDKSVTYQYNLIGKVDVETKRDGSKIYYWHDQLGNVLYESDDPDGPDSTGNPDFLTEFIFDGAGQLVYADKMVDNAIVSVSEFTYNGFGARTCETAQYDANSISKTTLWTYDGAGNQLTQAHGDTVLTYTHDGLGRIKTIDKGNDEIVTYDYVGRSTEAIDYPQADTTQLFAYDDLGRITECESVDVNDVAILDFQYTYDEVGNRKQCKYNHLATPIYDKYYYDSLRRLTKAEYAQTSGFVLASDVLPLDDLVLVASAWLNDDVVDYANFTEYKNNILLSQRLEQMEIVLEEAGYKNINAFLNSVKGIQAVAYNPDEPIYTFAVFDDDVPNNYTTESVTNDNGDVIAQIIWDNKDRMVLFAMYPDSGDTVVVSKSYDNQGNLTANTITTFDADGNVTHSENMLAAEEETLTASALSVPSMSLMTSSVTMSSEPEAPAAKAEEFKLDHLGNRYEYTGKNSFTYAYEHNSVNQYQGRQASIFGLTLTDTYSHDDNGNLSVDENGWSYSYDYRNRLVEVEDSNSVTIAEYAFDALGRRIAKTVGSETTYFFYDTAGRVIAEYDDSITPVLEREYVYGNGIDEVLAMFTPYHAGDPNDFDEFIDFCDAWLSDPNDTGTWVESFDNNDDDIINFEDFAYFASIWDIPSNTESDWYYLHDALGSTRGLAGGRFNRESDREFWNYDVYGALSIVDDEESKASNPYLFTGRRYDSETGLYYYRTRNLDPETARMLQFDRGYFDGMNMYEYVMSNPVLLTDPYGLYSRQHDRPAWTVGASKPWSYLSEETRREREEYRRQKEIMDRIYAEAESIASENNDYIKELGNCCGLGLETTLAIQQGTQQGVLNTINGLQDVAIGVLNMPLTVYNSGVWLNKQGDRMGHRLGSYLTGSSRPYEPTLPWDESYSPYIPSPDWSKNAIVREGDLAHGASKFVSGESAAFLATVGLSAVVSSSSKASQGASCASKCANASDDFVNLASKQRTTHILTGDKTGGGHLWPGNPGKTPFPKGWTPEKIMHEVSDIATDPTLQRVWQKGSHGSMFTRSGKPSRYVVEGVRDGVRIKVVIEPAGEGIITAHPIN